MILIGMGRFYRLAAPGAHAAAGQLRDLIGRAGGDDAVAVDGHRLHDAKSLGQTLTFL